MIETIAVALIVGFVGSGLGAFVTVQVLKNSIDHMKQDIRNNREDIQEVRAKLFLTVGDS